MTPTDASNQKPYKHGERPGVRIGNYGLPCTCRYWASDLAGFWYDQDPNCAFHADHRELTP